MMAIFAFVSPTESHPAGSAATGLLVLVICFIFYFLPTVTAAARHTRNGGIVLLLNLFLGWTIIGWMLAMGWALKDDP